MSTTKIGHALDMPVPFDVAAGSWWRFSRYRIDGRVIRPARGAELERYDPWSAYQAWRTGQAGSPPYRSLLALAQNLSFQPKPGPGPLRELTPASQKAVFEWCAQHGLLGLLSHRVLSAWLPPSWQPAEEDATVLVPTQLQYCRTNEGWSTFAKSHRGPKLGALRNKPDRRGEVIETGPDDNRWRRPGVIIQPLDQERTDWESFAETFVRFFPDVPNHGAGMYAYPAPLSEAFWHSYAEPVEDFVRAANTMRRALYLLEIDPEPDDGHQKKDPGQVRGGMDLLHALIRTSRPALTLTEDGSYRQEWLSASLLGAMAMMAFLDLSQDRKIMTCEVCGSLFVTGAYQARYCSSTCRYRAQKRRHRARKRGIKQSAVKANRLIT